MGAQPSRHKDLDWQELGEELYRRYQPGGYQRDADQMKLIYTGQAGNHYMDARTGQVAFIAHPDPPRKPKKPRRNWLRDLLTPKGAPHDELPVVAESGE